MAGIEGGKPYYLGSWCRSPFDPSRFPQSLNAMGGRSHLDNFDTPAGNLWTFRFIGSNASVFSDPKMAAALHSSQKGPGTKRGGRDEGDKDPSKSGDTTDSRCFTLGCINYYSESSKNMAFLGPDLSIVHDEGRAQLWQGIPHPALRVTVPGEVSLQIKAHGSDKLLCSDEKRRTVYLLKKADAQLKDPATGAFVFNDSWEATPDEDPPPESLSSLRRQA